MKYPQRILKKILIIIKSASKIQIIAQNYQQSSLRNIRKDAISQNFISIMEATMIKPILVIKQKCKECKGNSGYYLGSIKPNNWHKCKSCKGTGEQEMGLTPLRDFENLHIFKNNYKKRIGTGYKIPKGYEPYEIKKVSEITEEDVTSIVDEIENYSFKKKFDNYWKVNPKLSPDTAMCRYWFLIKHNLKEDDKVVITNAQ